MICIPSSAIHEKAKKMPVDYLKDCKASAKIRDDKEYWCFKPSDFFKIRQKYRGYAVSESDRYREGEIISGCCDRADQY